VFKTICRNSFKSIPTSLHIKILFLRFAFVILESLSLFVNILIFISDLSLRDRELTIAVIKSEIALVATKDLSREVEGT